jgi:hypothetical protein
MYRRYILKYFDRRIPYGTTLYTQVPSNERWYELRHLTILNIYYITCF